MPWPRKHDLVVRTDFWDGGERFLDLARKNVDATDHQHVVRSADHPPHACQGSAATTRLSKDRAKVSRSVADQRQRFLGQGSEDQLPDSAIRDRRARRRVDCLHEKMVLGNMRAVLGLAAFRGDPRADYLA